MRTDRWTDIAGKRVACMQLQIYWIACFKSFITYFAWSLKQKFSWVKTVLSQKVMNDPPPPKKGKKLSMSMSIHALVRGFVDQLVSWFISLLVDPSIRIFLLPSVDPYMFICPSSCLSILFSVFHPSVYLSKKQGGIHGNPVADGWAGAVMGKPIVI